MDEGIRDMVAGDHPEGAVAPGRRGPAVVVGFLLVVAFSLLAVADSRFGARFRAKRLACAANARMILGAVEMAKERLGPARRAVIDWEGLQEAGGLKTIPACPETGTASYHLYAVGTASETVLCELHGLVLENRSDNPVMDWQMLMEMESGKAETVATGSRP